ncbi:hypothetical protein HXX76_006863 [Chlamydomonas incerta]|uniref:DUF4145 domain-containing protein n=1 Tax=Chlamydomonas incerta TaxID=51695 RepID=A0A835T1L6_CHLIN|nr:hypothetical protein HXX76_006863 [Chlamydomonas incerta]|eukprot:KAG2435661.1 hypothetical protein HXX76_006863 [Chlamydomonas incerta]
MKGRMERTLKEDLQDDLQVLIDLIQHSCKPHPRPPRAGMKTLIVQGRILAEAIAQDALFQLDPEPAAASDPAAAASRPDLVELINRLREHHGNSLLSPALHVLRTLGNTAVHLDRDSARLTDAEIGDAAAVCCRLVVHVVDAYMHMCANLHKHDETEEALAQPLQEAPVAPLPAPNVLLRPRDQSLAAPTVSSTPASANGSIGSGSAPRVANHALGRAAGSGRSATGPGMAAAPAAARRVSGSGNALGHSDEDGEDDIVYSAGGGRRYSAGGGGGRSHGGSTDGGGPGGRVPYSLVPPDWAGSAPVFGASSVSAADAALDAAQCPSRAGAAAGSRNWWPAMDPTDAAAAAVSATPVVNMLRRPAAADMAAAAADAAAGAVPYSTYMEVAPAAAPQQAASVTDWLEAFSLGSAPTTGAAPAMATGRGSDSGGGGAAGNVGAHPTAPYVVPPAAFAAGGSPHPPYVHGVAASADSWGTSSAAQAARAYYHTPAQPGPGAPLAGGSPTRRSPLTLTTDPHHFLGGVGSAHAHSSHAAPPAPARGASPPPVPFAIPRPMPGSGTSPPRHPCDPAEPQSQTPGAAASGSGGGAGAGTSMAPAEASKRLLQLCATAQAPSAAKVLQLLAAGATLAVTDKSGMNALHMACYWCHAEAAGLLLGRAPTAGGRATAGASGSASPAAAAAAAADREGRTPLWVASQRGHVELVQLLLARAGVEGGVDVNAANSAAVTPLRVAAAQGHTEVVAALLAAGAAPDMADKDAFTPLYVACARSHLEVVRLLLAAGAPPDRCDKGGRTPLWAALHPGGSAKAEACPERRSAVVRALLAAGADVHLLPDVRDRDYCWQVLAQSIAAGE